MVIVWRVRGKVIRCVLCNIVCSNCAQCNAYTHEQTNSSLEWVRSHSAHSTVLRSIFVFCVSLCIACMCSIARPIKPVPNVTYNVFSGTLNPVQSVNQAFYVTAVTWPWSSGVVV